MDPIADMLTRIRNAQLVLKEDVLIPYSRMKFHLAKILEQKGFVKNVDTFGRKARKKIKIGLRYDEDKRPLISGLERVSKQGQRIYKRAKEIKPVRGGAGMSIISSSQGLMTGREAKKRNLGGEHICNIW